MQFFKDKGIKVVTVYPPATYTAMTTDRDDMEPVPEKEAQPSDIAKAAMLVRCHVPVLTCAVNFNAVLSVNCLISLEPINLSCKYIAQLQRLCLDCCESHCLTSILCQFSAMWWHDTLVGVCAGVQFFSKCPA